MDFKRKYNHEDTKKPRTIILIFKLLFLFCLLVSALNACNIWDLTLDEEPFATGVAPTVITVNASPNGIPEKTPAPTGSFIPPPTLTTIPTRIQPVETTIEANTPASTPTTPANRPVSFAVIGDYGLAGQIEWLVAHLVKSWDPDFIITTGDNNYPDGSVESIDNNIGQYYSKYIYPYTGVYGNGAEENRFFPTLGNHDWNTPDLAPYYDYFSLPGNERYYDFTWGPLHMFALDSDSHEPDGVSRGSAQAKWLEEGLKASTSPWKIVFMHHPPYSSGRHGSIDWMQWPFQEWGATAVIAGHDHLYERIMLNGFPNFINGLGGSPARYNFRDELVDGSVVRYNAGHGAMLVEADEEKINFQFFNTDEELVDSLIIIR